MIPAPKLERDVYYRLLLFSSDRRLLTQILMSSLNAINQEVAACLPYEFVQLRVHVFALHCVLLSQAFKRPPDTEEELATILAVARWDKTKAEAEYLHLLETDNWEVAIPQIVTMRTLYPPSASTL